MGAALHDLKTVAHHYSVELGDWPAGVEASAAIGEAVMMGKIAKAAPMGTPLVQVAHQYGAHLPVTGCEVREDGAGLAPAPQARKVEMHSDNPKRNPAHPKVGKHGASRLERWEVH